MPEKRKQRREVVFISAKDWQRKLAELEKMPANERKEFDAKRRFELSIIDLRDDAISLIHNKVGSGESAYEIIHSRGGCAKSTYESWAKGEVLRPQTTSFYKTAIALGLRFGFYKGAK